MFSARARRFMSPKEAASAAKLSWLRHSAMGCAATVSHMPQRCHTGFHALPACGH
jgi:hypothetical protein